MRLRIAFVHETGQDDEMPTTLAITDEYIEDIHGGIPDYYTDAIKDAEADACGVVREMFVNLFDDDVAALFGTPLVVAKSSGSAHREQG